MTEQNRASVAHPYRSVTVIGAGSWGTALAAVLARAGRSVTIWGRNEDAAHEINTHCRNSKYLPDIDLPPMRATTDLADALKGAEAVLVVTPSRTLRDMCARIAPHVDPTAPVALCAKGIETGTGLLMSEVAAEELHGNPIGAISGPTFAAETAMAHPTAATVAFPFTYHDRLAPHESPAARLAVSLGSATFRPYLSDDLTGVEIGGAVKNVIAIACGMMMGAGFAENTRAALISMGIEEMKALAEALGGRRETVTGLTGTGDLTLTCSSTTSRNMSLGMQLGQGIARDKCFDGRPVVVEGEVNAVSIVQLADRIGLPMPICRVVHAILHDGADLRGTFADFWSRPIQAEPRAMEISLDHPFGTAAEPALPELDKDIA